MRDNSSYVAVVTEPTQVRDVNSGHESHFRQGISSQLCISLNGDDSMHLRTQSHLLCTEGSVSSTQPLIASRRERGVPSELSGHYSPRHGRL